MLSNLARTSSSRLAALIVGLLTLLTACGPTATSQSAAPAPQQTPSQPARTLVAAVRNEPPGIAELPIISQSAGIALYFTKRMFNADLTILDGDGNPQPYLADALPELNTPSWQVFDDGRMQTTYHLKPNITWHDGSPLTADDFVFSWTTYSTPAFGYTSLAPFSVIDGVTAPDPRTIVIDWTSPYPQAGSLQSFGTGAVGLPALPRAILGPLVADGSPEAIGNSPYWNRSFVGLGPYRLDNWQQGSFLEASAFAQHVGGAPKIQHITVRFISDGNTVLANLLSGDIQLATDVALGLGLVPEVLSRWGPGNGSAVLDPNQWRASYIQMRPDFVNPSVLLDPRVRKAMAYAVDKDAVNTGAWAGQATNADTMVSPNSPAGKVVEPSVTKYPLDLHQSEQLMASAGFTKGPDGTYTSPTAGRFSTTLQTNTSPNNEAENTILGAGWRQAGFDVQESVMPAALAADKEARATFTGLFTSSTNVGEQIVLTLTTDNIARPDNHWAGQNRGGYSNPDYDRLAGQFATVLDRTQRYQVLAQMMKIFSDDEPAISIQFQSQAWVFPPALTGPKLVAPESNVAWNMMEWEFH